MAQQAIVPLTDEELATVKDDPALVAKLTSEERRRLSALQPIAKPHPEATIGPDTGSLTSPDRSGVTLGDVMQHPMDSAQRMWSITKQGLSDPRNTIPAALGIVAGATGLMPRSFEATREGYQGVGARVAAGNADAVPSGAQGTAPPPVAATAASRPGLGQAIRQNVSMDDVVDAIPGSRTAKAAYRVARGVQRAVTGKAGDPQGTPAPEPVTPGRQAAGADVSAPGRQAAASATSATTAPASATAPAPNQGTSPTTTGSAAQARRGAVSPQRSRGPKESAGPSLGAFANSLTPAEQVQVSKWLQKNVPYDEIVTRVKQSRALTKSTGTDTPDQAAEAVRRRNETGKWD